ncbi:efflux transporter outer membrane subunit [Solimonas marina]|uniref:Efflux transporter outer membrane subunit n=1 Tax=Solimonas marina TaxID=2714601 RepID=A0A970BB04_9GAMM|nr:efflux transporter outer membrane subunit [Solimonas marina]NKF23901.1 efflux transporter outer membrane subunit [Solimonas marina]
MNRPRHPYSRLLGATAGATLVLLTGCAVGPDYHRPDVPVTHDRFKEAGGDWLPAAPADALSRAPWWTLFNDPQLDQFVAQVEVSNQNVAAAVASYAQARATVREERAAIFPTIDLSAGATRSGTKSSGSSTVVSTGGTSVTSSGSSRVRNTYQTDIGASWEPDIWGVLRRGIENANATLSASAADLQAATLSARGELVTDYLSLREADAEIALLEKTVDGYQRALEITQNRYKVGVAPKSDVLSAQSTLYSTQAELEAMRNTRAQYEHAIAVLLGKAPSDFSLAPADWNGTVPNVPVGLPSTLLQRRPDIAAAERNVAAANATVGIQQAAWFPSLTLSASYGTSSSSLHKLFDASSALWSLGASAAETLIDFGARRGAIDAARAAYDQAVASYRETTLEAFQDVEDNLSATRALEKQYALRQQASTAADENERVLLNQYRAGQVAYSDVVTAQASALSARRSLVQVALSRQTTAVALIQALGGGWQAGDTPQMNATKAQG